MLKPHLTSAGDLQGNILLREVRRRSMGDYFGVMGLREIL